MRIVDASRGSADSVRLHLVIIVVVEILIYCSIDHCLLAAHLNIGSLLTENDAVISTLIFAVVSSSKIIWLVNYHATTS